MLDDSSPDTFYSLRALSQISIEKRKPLVLWVGAGVSCWRGFPNWKALAETFHDHFSKFNGQFDRAMATRLVESQDYPGLFQLCRDTEERRYFSLLGDSLKPRRNTPVYVRFIESLHSIEPISIITTNVDESLETSIDGITTLQRPDAARSLELLRNEEPFLIKAHGAKVSLALRYLRPVTINHWYMTRTILI